MSVVLASSRRSNPSTTGDRQTLAVHTTNRRRLMPADANVARPTVAPRQIDRIQSGCCVNLAPTHTGDNGQTGTDSNQPSTNLHDRHTVTTRRRQPPTRCRGRNSDSQHRRRRDTTRQTNRRHRVGTRRRRRRQRGRRRRPSRRADETRPTRTNARSRHSDSVEGEVDGLPDRAPEQRRRDTAPRCHRVGRQRQRPPSRRIDTTAPAGALIANAATAVANNKPNFFMVAALSDSGRTSVSCDPN